MCFVQNFVCGPYTTKKAALVNLRELQKNASVKLKIKRVQYLDSILFYVVY